MTTSSFDRTDRKRTLHLLMSVLMLFLAATLFTSCKKGQMDYKKGVAAFEDEEYEVAVKAFKKSAKKGHVEAQIMVGMCYEKGYGVDEDIEEAMDWYRKAADSEDPLAEAVYGMGLIGKEKEKGIKYLKKAANKGCALAQTTLGIIYLDKDEEEAVKYLKKAAGQSLTGRKTVLDIFMEKEDHNPITDVLEDEEICVEDASIVSAQVMLVAVYLEGLGVERSTKEAKKWFEKAKKNGLSKKVQKKIKRELDDADD